MQFFVKKKYRAEHTRLQLKRSDSEGKTFFIFLLVSQNC